VLLLYCGLSISLFLVYLAAAAAVVVVVVVVVVVMKRISFSRTETVYEVDNYHRTSPWE